jgi:glycerophosphoryl diester phosphodiesterase
MAPHRYGAWVNRTPYGPGPLVYAHRGASAHARGNSIEAFTLAVEAGADGIELDVRRTLDGILVIAHDAAHRDIGPLADATFATIRDVDDEIPTLAEGLAVIPPHLFVNVEIKNARTDSGFDANRTIVDQTIAQLTETDEPARILITSFDPLSTRRAKLIAPDMAVGQLIAGRTPVGPALRWAHRLGFQTINVDRARLTKHPEEIVVRAAKAGVAVMAWTVDEPDEIAALYLAGVTGVISNDPAIARLVADRIQFSD